MPRASNDLFDISDTKIDFELATKPGSSSWTQRLITPEPPDVRDTDRFAKWWSPF